MEDDWDLQAVVRGCASATSSSSSTTTTLNSTYSIDAHPLSSTGQLYQEDRFRCFSDLFEPRSCENTIEELHDLYKHFFPRSQSISPQSIPISPLSVLGGLQDLSPTPPTPLPPQHQQQQQQQNQVQHQKQSFVGLRSTVASASQTATKNTQSSRSKRRKNQFKRVCEVPAEGLSSDMWSWRKYGQKPIKGSPYPRGYYRCSTSKGCLARKQVERNRSDPGMFIVTYTADHNHPMPTHRNSLAGSTRQKPVTPQTVTDGENSKPSCSTPVSPATSFSPATEKMDGREDRDDMVKVEEEEEDEDFGVSDAAIDDDFFEGLEDFAGDCLSDDLPAGLSFPWLADKPPTTAAGPG